MRRDHVDEALCLARYFEQHAARVEVLSCSGEWRFPLLVDDQLPRLRRGAPDQSAVAVTVAPTWSMRNTLV